ncbi:hypothetical protein OV208_34470 [Corallococcus sp. bb12-1]|uniref:SPW repeat domain-containing protein n=1 Tax=Corallococcus sp. bb12-1 TaxID=2996784 RepID=UPI00227212CA|nr:hypothetical protein [Corallococcus sp. bb12-1]MCY1046461.1 hypothetical protein [Corallococcus sp. bb12-1]
MYQVRPLEPVLPPVPPRPERALRREWRRLVDHSAAAGILSRPLFGRLPLRRVLPQDMHSVLDYVAGAALVGAGVAAGDGPAKTAGWALGGAALGVSLFTDYRLSLAKLIPIEAHELADYAYGAGAVLAPFLFGYAKRRPAAAAVHVLVGLFTVAASLYTDYRCQTGMHLGGELATDPEGLGA